MSCFLLLQGHWCSYIDDIGPAWWNHREHCNRAALGSILSSSYIHRLGIACWRRITMFDAAEYDKKSTVITIILSTSNTTTKPTIISKRKLENHIKSNKQNRQSKQQNSHSSRHSSCRRHETIPYILLYYTILYATIHAMKILFTFYMIKF